MCSVVGYIGSNKSSTPVIQGLSRLEYRGYDSAGFACYDSSSGKICAVKTAGSVDSLRLKLSENPIEGSVGIGHTRWATHGVANELNAHPHLNQDRTVAVVHNGIVENYAALKQSLVGSGHFFYSDTDTEIIAHLLGNALQQKADGRLALLAVAKKLEGAFSFCALVRDLPDCLLVWRRKSPLCIGIGKGEMFVASDPSAFAEWTKQIVFVPEDAGALVFADRIELFDHQGHDLPLEIQELDVEWLQGSSGGFAHIMLKEMYEQKRVIGDTVSFFKSMDQETWAQTGIDQRSASKIEALHFVACGTSAHAAEIAAFFFEELCAVPVTVSIASEFRYKKNFLKDSTLCCFLSQSGETADTLEAMRSVAATDSSVPTLAVVNVPTSSMVRESRGYIITQAQREVAVASTKSFTSQVALLYLLAHKLAVLRGHMAATQLEHAYSELMVCAEVLEITMEQYKRQIREQVAPAYAHYEKYIFLGRHISYPFASEASLKMREIAYRFVDCYPAGELKHGPIALVEPSVPVVIFSVLDDQLYQKLLVNAQEVKARRGHLMVFAFEGQTDLIALADTALVIPRVARSLGPLVMTGVMQLLVYEVARELGCPIDKPRNLAKSVTVE